MINTTNSNNVINTYNSRIQQMTFYSKTYNVSVESDSFLWKMCVLSEDLKADVIRFVPHDMPDMQDKPDVSVEKNSH